MFNKTGEIRALTGLRGVAAVVVMAYHYRNLGLMDRRCASPLGPGYLMVDLFFILSGFVMARTYAGAFASGFTRRAYLGFLEARLARVYPLYAIVTVGMFAAVCRLASDYPAHTSRALASNLLLLQNLGLGLVWPGSSEKLALPGWSISTEAAAYLLFPALAWAALFRSRRGALALLAASFCGLALIATLPFAALHAGERRGLLDVSEGTTLWPLLRCLAGFSAGLVLWRAAAGGYRPRQVAAFVFDVLICGAIAILWFVPGSDLALVVMFALLIWHLTVADTPLTRLMGRGVLYQAGEWSYAVYLLHFPALMTMGTLFPLLRGARLPHAWSLTLAVIAAFTILLAALAHRFVERPARRELRAVFYRRRFPMRLEPSAP